MRWILLIVIMFSGVATKAQQGISFIENKCQWNQEVLYLANVGGGTFSLQPSGFSFAALDTKRLADKHHDLHDQQDESWVSEEEEFITGHRVNIHFKGSNPLAKKIPFGLQPQYYNYFLTANASDWVTDVHAFDGVVYQQFYPGIDLQVSAEDENVKYEFIVHPGASPDIIQFNYQGTRSVKLADGELVVNTPVFSFIEKKPVIYQLKEGVKHNVAGNYQINDGAISYCLDAYDPCYDLIIDPVLIFSTYSGSTADNWGSTATPGERGTLYSAGVTNLARGGTYPATTGAFQIDYGGLYDVGLLKYDSTGSKLLYASYLGGKGSESAHSLVVTKENDLLVLGSTSSNDFPTSADAFDRTYGGGSTTANVIEYFGGSDIFISRLSADGSVLIGSTLLGGSGNDGLNPEKSPLVVNYGDQLRGDIISDAEGNIYISSVTSSFNFPAENSFSNIYTGGLTDAVVAKLNPTLSGIIWSAFIGGSGADASHTIKFDADMNLIVGGGTTSLNFPTTAGAYQTALAGGVDGWVGRVTNDGTALLNATLTGTTGFNQVYFVDLDKIGNIYLYGQTSGAFPVTNGVYRNANSGQFLQKLTPDMKALVYSTVFGAGRGIPDISPTAFLVNDCNNIYLSGWGGGINSVLNFWNSSTIGMPVTPDAFQKTTSGSDFYFIVLSSDATKLLYATFLGGNSSRTHVDGGTSRFDKSGIVYHAVCSGCAALNATNGPTSDFPTTSLAWSRLNRSNNCNNAAFKFDLSLLKARIQTNAENLKQPGKTLVCLPEKIVFQNRSFGGQIHEWSFGDGSSLSKLDTSAIIHQYKQPGVYRVRLKITDFGTCQGIDSTFVNVTVRNPQGFAGPDLTMCFNAGAQLVAGGGLSYQWTSTDKRFNSALQSPTVNPAVNTAYYVAVTDAFGCVKKDTLNVNVVPDVELAFESKRIFDCENRASLELINLANEKDSTYFDLGDGNISKEKVYTHNYKADGIYTVSLVGILGSCTYKKQITVPIFTVFVPNVITPDESPENNTFRVLNNPLASVNDLVFSLEVYNRWGKLVYRNQDYQNDWNASNVENGVYFYELKLGEEEVCKGWLSVVK